MRLRFPFFQAPMLALLTSLACFGQSSAQLAAPARPMIVQRVNEGELATLKGNTRPEARAAYDRGAVSANLPMPGMMLVLKRSPEQEAAIVAYADSLQTPGSANYHHWLTPAQQGILFGPAQTDLEAITNWLLSHGFTIDEVAQNHMSIQFSGTAAQVQAAFHTEIHNLDVKGAAHIANMSDPQIPAALSPAVSGVQALHNFFARPMHHLGATVQRDAQTGKWKRIGPAAAPAMKEAAAAPGAINLPAPLFNTGGTANGVANIEDIGPYDFATIYNVLPLWNASSPIDGKGQTIAVVGTSDINPADLTTFRAAFGLPAYAAATGSTPGFSVIHPNTAPGACPTAANSCDGDLTENSLDVEWAGAIAKNASIVLVASSAALGNAFSADPVYIGANYIVANHTANIVNVSYGLCELGIGTAGNAGWNTLWQTAAVSGISVFVSSGDSGAASCDDGGDNGGSSVPYGAQYGLSVSGLASTPYNVAVGGTDFNWGWLTNGQSTYWNTTNTAGTLASAKGYIPEGTWNDTCTNAFFDAYLDGALSQNLSPNTLCNAIGTGRITFGGSPAYELVDSIGGSGGASNCTTNDNMTVASCTGGYAKPSWQTGVTGIPADGKRDIPDVSFFASNGFSGSAYVICVSANSACSYTAGAEPTGQEVGGTSVSSPIMAGVMALINQQAGSAQGLPNAVLYKMAAKQTYSNCSTGTVANTSTCYFNDIDAGTAAYNGTVIPGTITMACDAGSPNCTATVATAAAPFGLLTGYNTTTGFDLATGLGSLNVANVVNAYVATAAPAVTLSPTSLTFASTGVGITTGAQTVTLTNSGINPLVVTAVTVTGTNTSSFSATPTGCTSVASGNTCLISVTFTPQAIGALSASISIADNATGTPQTVALTGTGLSTTPVATLTPTSLTFPSTTVGVSSSAQTVTLSNSGINPLVVTTLTVTGTNATSFSATPTGCTSVTNGSSCTISVTFKPLATGTLTASISIADNATGSPQTIALTGVGAELGTYTLSAAAASIAVGSSGTSAITATSSGGYVGPNVVTLSACTLATSPTGATKVPTCAVTLAAVTFGSGSTAGTGGVVTVSTTAATSSVRTAAIDRTIPWKGGAGVAIAGALLLLLPGKRRRVQALLTVLLLAGTLGVLSGCGGSSGSSGGTTVAGTTAGTYTFTVTGQDAGGVSQTATLTVTVH